MMYKSGQNLIDRNGVFRCSSMHIKRNIKKKNERKSVVRLRQEKTNLNWSDFTFKCQKECDKFSRMIKYCNFLELDYKCFT